MVQKLEWIEDGRILLLTLAGFWDEASVASFEDATRYALARRTSEHFYAVCDASEMNVQSGETQRRVHHLLDEMRSAGMIGGAMVVTSALLKMQLGRTVDQGRTRYFANIADARAWARAAAAAVTPPDSRGDNTEPARTARD